MEIIVCVSDVSLIIYFLCSRVHGLSVALQVPNLAGVHYIYVDFKTVLCCV